MLGLRTENQVGNRGYKISRTQPLALRSSILKANFRSSSIEVFPVETWGPGTRQVGHSGTCGHVSLGWRLCRRPLSCTCGWPQELFCQESRKSSKDTSKSLIYFCFSFWRVKTLWNDGSASFSFSSSLLTRMPHRYSITIDREPLCLTVHGLLTLVWSGDICLILHLKENDSLLQSKVVTLNSKLLLLHLEKKGET